MSQIGNKIVDTRPCTREGVQNGKSRRITILARGHQIAAPLRPDKCTHPITRSHPIESCLTRGVSGNEFWISSCRVRNAPNDVWDDNIAHFDLRLRENVSRYAR